MQKKEFEVLKLLEQSSEPLTQRNITQLLGLSLGTVNKVVRSLTYAGFMANGKITNAGIEALEPYRVKRAVFLAAGFGSRMVPLTFNTPKPLVRVHGTRMIDTLLDAVIAAGIPEIIIVRGYLGEQFDQLLYKYPMIKFMENPIYNEANNISSALVARYLLQNAYVLEADLVLSNPKLIRKYEFTSNFMGIPVELSDDWCLYTDKNGIITRQCVGGRNCYQMVGISYWSAEAGAKLANDIEEVYRSPGGKERYWEQVALLYKKENYKVEIRECAHEDVVEIDSFNELKRIDPLYAD
ncbi:MAG: winged helix-turn-helix transcriptional regulator [Ruminococcaceae bacterium]|nr:winged helix-turn-helix transcriptional regulator [Oscillospiraceae bacterium]